MKMFFVNHEKLPISNFYMFTLYLNKQQKTSLYVNKYTKYDRQTFRRRDIITVMDLKCGWHDLEAENL